MELGARSSASASASGAVREWCRLTPAEKFLLRASCVVVSE